MGKLGSRPWSDHQHLGSNPFNGNRKSITRFGLPPRQCLRAIEYAVSFVLSRDGEIQIQDELGIG
jgi:hypothetical protein